MMNGVAVIHPSITTTPSIHPSITKIMMIEDWRRNNSCKHFDKRMKEDFLYNVSSLCSPTVLPFAIHDDMVSEACFALMKLIFFEYLPLDVFYFIYMSIFIFTNRSFMMIFVLFNLFFFIQETFRQMPEKSFSVQSFFFVFSNHFFTDSRVMIIFVFFNLNFSSEKNLNKSM